MKVHGCWKNCPFYRGKAMLAKETAIPEHGKGYDELDLGSFGELETCFHQFTTDSVSLPVSLHCETIKVGAILIDTCPRTTYDVAIFPREEVFAGGIRRT
jgi:hypothetical protein